MRQSIMLLAIALCLLSCSDKNESTTPWPSSYDDIFRYTITDASGDLQLANSDQPPHLIQFAPMDVTKIQLGFSGEYLYLRVDYADTIPQLPVELTANDTVEAQLIKNQSISVVIDADNSDTSGASGESVKGVDIFFALNFIYGSYSLQYANFDFPGTDIHIYNGDTKGELGEGGPGTTYAIVRYKKEAFQHLLSPGKTVEIGGWAESESYDAMGKLKYHHFAFDAFTPGVWTIE